MKRLLLAATFAVATATPAAAITFNYTGSIVTWTAPQDGTYEIVATGAQGGTATTFQQSAAGRGALIGGYFELTGGTILSIAVGGIGPSAPTAGGGGGGSFVVAPGDSPLVIAGGGGGLTWARFGTTGPGRDANTGQAGLGNDGTPLSSDIGFGAVPSDPRGSGGGGFNSGGTRATFAWVASGGGSWATGLAGGVYVSSGPCTGGAAGGFGGGGDTCGLSGGGGGGYSGGQGGPLAGGGGSFNADTLTGWSLAGAGIGNGLVTINLVVEEVTTPEPASATLALLGLFGLTALRRRR